MLRGRCRTVPQVFLCRVLGFPTRYLGAPLSITRLCRANEQALVDSVTARIPTWKAGLLTNAGRATLTQTTLSAVPIHISICCNLSPWAIREIDKHRRVFLWAGTDSVAGGKCRVAWPVVCSPRDLGGLGLPDLRILGFALRLRWVWLRRTQPEAPWAQLPSKPERLVDSMFRTSVTVHWATGRLLASGLTLGCLLEPSAHSRQTSFVRSDAAGGDARCVMRWRTGSGRGTSPGRPPLRSSSNTYSYGK
jgi:hypothetical protein